MSSLIYNSLFSLVSIFILLKTVGFAIYEIKSFNNKIGGSATIIFSVLVVILFNTVLWLK